MRSRKVGTSAGPSHNEFVTPFIASSASVLFLLFLCLRFFTLRLKRTTPSSDPPHHYSFHSLRRATNSFSTRIGHGGFGPVFSALLPPSSTPVAVKFMDSTSLQGQREFHNELFFAPMLRSSYVVPPIGFCSEPQRRRFLLVYHLMDNGNLHDALLRRNSPHFINWNKRFHLIFDIAKGIQYLHSFDTPIIHGDIKPSNILLDRCFSAKIADFGLAQFKTDQLLISAVESENKINQELDSEVEDTECVTVLAEMSSLKKNHKGNEVRVSCSGPVVKDYVMDWIGKEVEKEIGKVELVIGADSNSGSSIGKTGKNKSKKKLEWWESMDEQKEVLNKVKRKPVREWWKEEYSQDLAKEKKKNKKKQQQYRNGGNSDDDLWVRDDALYSDLYVNKSKTKHSRRNSGSSVDSWFRGISGELRRAGRNSYESAASGEIPKSGVSTTPSMRGTMFYVAPEYGYNGDVLSEKCDVYSFGVLLLVIISGRRPLQVMTSSPISEFQRANLVSWARLCARKGKLIELVDQSIQSLDKEQALLCIKLALLCLQKSPVRRPSMNEVVGMLSGELEPPQLPVEHSSSPSHFPFKSKKEESRNVNNNNSSRDYPWEIYTLKELLRATNNFHQDNKIGEGGFGSVYWGRSSKGIEIAVKRLKAMTAKAEMEFAVEVEVLGRVRHKNLLGLRGFYAGGEERLIVYDYMPNHSLLTHLHAHLASHCFLDWPTRMRIAIGSAEGLAYLHHEANPHIIHRDIKASNVLLDNEFEAKVADFGFAKLIPEGVTHVTTRVKGTLGYLAPEYAMWGKVSESCDVYSFGILLIEIISAKKPIEKLPGGVKRDIVQWVTPYIQKGVFNHIADAKLKGKFDIEQLKSVITIAMRCTDISPDKRPSMEEVVEWLKGNVGKRRKEILTLSYKNGEDNDENYEEIETKHSNLKVVSENDRHVIR
ncbi:PREDICTED: receptor-like serine/threonine-protein kinase At4g25390 [Lupinus angustifolius]|uniref:receptor-like serine/threonine-protein kinase At4g25390 n=1 Tax=Lupinus angustifolius TaxID=3871 RepID=UPI00092FCA64|nr:PREDICTED: receptor-like serine/threonine-protein kinase At4g25390 [Lupinus angustifolius]